MGNNLKVFFIRDPIKFPDLVHSFKPDPVTGRQDPRRIFDFISMMPEATHMITWLFSPWGIPACYRTMQGSGVNTYKWVNAEGEAVLVKYHWDPQQGVRNLTQKEADALSANFNHATQDLYEAIERGEHPRWELQVQIMEDHEHPELDFDPLDPTKIWPEDRFPLMPVGMMTLDRNPANYFAEVEQAAFGTGVLVDGLDFSDDKLLQGRTFSYSDTQRYRVGANYLQLPVNRPKVRVATNQRDGQMALHVDGIDDGVDPHVNYAPSNRRGLVDQEPRGRPHEPEVAGRVGRWPLDRPNDFGQAGLRWRAFEPWERDELVSNLVAALAQCEAVVQEKMVRHFTLADRDYGARVARGLGLDPSRVAAE